MKNTYLNQAVWTYHPHAENVVIMIHGFRGTHHGLDLIAKQLNGFKVIVPDLPGFGEAAPLNVEHDLDNYVAWLAGFIKDLKLKKQPILLGHSFGSIVAASYAAKYPETIYKLILVNPIGAPALEGPKAILTQLAVFYYFVGRKLPAELAKKWLASKPVVMIMSLTMAKTKDKKLRQFIHKQHLLHFSSFDNPKMLSEAFKTSVTQNVRMYAPKINLPTLLIAGDRDDITPLAKQQSLVGLFKNAELVVIENVGHLTHYETPDQVADAVRHFIN
jgi:pimeloyl-ACP methyl ester carboxylesterase